MNTSLHETDRDQLSAAEKVRKQVHQLVQALTAEPDQADVTLTPQQTASVITITCSKRDAPLLVGKGGAVIQAIQTVAGAIAAKNDIRCRVLLDA